MEYVDYFIESVTFLVDLVENGYTSKAYIVHRKNQNWIESEFLVLPTNLYKSLEFVLCACEMLCKKG